MAVLILQMWFVCQALALDPQASSYLRTDFTVEEGLPDNEVNAITQTANGFLWVGTDGGLARFDGQHFTQIRLRAGKRKEIPVSFLVTAQDGALWVGTESGLAYIPGAALDHFDRSLVTMYHPGVGPSDRISCLLIRDGILWVGTGHDHLVGDRFVPVRGAADEQDVPYGPLQEDSFGNLYAFSSVNGISRIEGNRLVSVNDALQPSGMVESHDHDFWLSGRDGIYRVAAGDLKHAELNPGSPVDYTSYGPADGLDTTASRRISSAKPAFRLGNVPRSRCILHSNHNATNMAFGVETAFGLLRGNHFV